MLVHLLGSRTSWKRGLWGRDRESVTSSMDPWKMEDDEIGEAAAMNGVSPKHGPCSTLTQLVVVTMMATIGLS